MISGGGIFLLILLLLVVSYLLLGILYRKCVVGASGIELIPNLNFWQKIGGLLQSGFSFTLKFIANRHNEEEGVAYRGLDSDDRMLNEDEDYDSDNNEIEHTSHVGTKPTTSSLGINISSDNNNNNNNNNNTSNNTSNTATSGSNKIGASSTTSPTPAVASRGFDVGDDDDDLLVQV